MGHSPPGGQCCSAAVLVLHPPVRGRGVLAAAAVAGPRAVQLLLRHELDHGGEVAVQVVHLVTAGVTKVGILDSRVPQF